MNPRFALVAAVLFVPALGCGDSGGDTSSSSTSVGDGDGDTSTGDGDGDTSTGDGDGDTSTGDGDGDGVAPCASAEDCDLANDCCTCAGVPAGMVPPCDAPECFAPACEAEFSDFGTFNAEAACVVGTCVLAPLSCNTSQVSCDVLEPPACEGGRVRSVVDECFGPCVYPSMCETLPFECDAGTCGEGFACMTTQSGAPSRCVPIPPSCGEATCACISPWLDEVCNGGCSDGGGTLLCEDGG